MALEEQALPVPATEELTVRPARRSNPLRTVLRFCKKKPLGAIGFAIVGIMFFLTLGTPTGEVGVPSLPDAPLGFELGPPWFERYRPEATFYDDDNRLRILEDPSANHWLGTDKNGRDVWARIVNGARRSLYVAIWALVVATVIGTAIGVVSGFFKGPFDTTAQRLMDALQAFPPLIALILIVTINPLSDTNSPNLTLAAVALGLVGIPTVQRIVRSVVLATREQQYVEAAKVIGATNGRTMFVYILPNIMASIIIVFSTGLGVVILAEAALSFVVPDKLPEGASWGKMLADAYAGIVDYPWPAVASAGAIALAVLGFNLAGDALRDVLDPRLRTG